jgi:long-chain acyl-CoA synthetase
VVLRPGAAITADELIAHCRGRLAGYKSVTLTAALPHSSTGKVLKARLAAE